MEGDKAALEADVQRLEAEIQQMEAELKPELAQVEDELKKSDEEKREMEARKTTLEEAEKSAKDEAEKAKESGDENAMSLAAREMDQIAVELADAVAQLNQKEEERQSLEAKKAALSLQLDDKKKELETQKSRLDRVDADKPQTESSATSQSDGAPQSVEAPQPVDAPQLGDAPGFNREQMLKTLEEEKAKAKIRLVQAQEGGGKQLNSDMDKWLDVLKKLRKDGVINESDVKLDKVEQKIKSYPVGDPKKIQEDIDEIDKITNIQDDKKFQEEYTKWRNKLQAGRSGSSPKVDGTPGKPGKGPDAGVLAELKQAEARAAKAATELETLKSKLAGYTKKENMTADDIRDMEEKQKLLMEKMAEFEEITKLIQRLIGLTETPSSQLGPEPSTDGDKGGRVEESLPKVIVCGTGDIDTVPRIIVCETAESKDGKRPVFQELPGAAKGKSGTGSLLSDQFYPGGGGYPGGSGFPGGPGGYPGVPSYLMASYPGGNPSQLGGYPDAPGVPSYPGGYLPGPNQLGGCPGVPGGPVYPGIGGHPGGVSYLSGPSPYPGYPVPNSPGNLGMPLVPPCLEYFNKSKEDKKTKKKRTEKIDYRDSSGCDNWCKDYYDNKKRAKRRKKCFCQLAGFCPND